MPSYLSADSIAAGAALVGGEGNFEPQRKNNWTLVCSPPGGDGRILALMLDAASIPKETTAVGVLDYGNEKRYFATKTTFGSVTLRLKDFLDRDTAEMIRKWREKVYNPVTGAVGRTTDYKVTGLLKLFGPDGKGVRTWELIGLWPTDVAYGEGLDMAAQGDTAANKIEATLQCDKMIYKGRTEGSIEAAA